ncbi:hypothetical protein G6F22_020560 [Rhizopus arrhizus]|nr:hypothetical protein G6F22_020560 [Rhizopus arrhizus]
MCRLDAARPGRAVGNEHLLHCDHARPVGALDGGHAGGHQAGHADIGQVLHAALVLRQAFAAVYVDDRELARPVQRRDHGRQLAQLDVGDNADFGHAAHEGIDLLKPVLRRDDGMARQTCPE